VDFSRHIQQLCSARVSNWRRNTAHDVVPSNLGGSAAPRWFLLLFQAQTWPQLL
jgi:hypothetical protein